MHDRKPIKIPILAGEKLFIDQCLKTQEEVEYISHVPYASQFYWKSIACCALILCSRPLNWARKKKQTLDISSIEEEH